VGSASHRNPRTCHAPQQAHGACANRKVLFQVKAGRGCLPRGADRLDQPGDARLLAQGHGRAQI